MGAGGGAGRDGVGARGRGVRRGRGLHCLQSQGKSGFSRTRVNVRTLYQHCIRETDKASLFVVVFCDNLGIILSVSP